MSIYRQLGCLGRGCDELDDSLFTLAVTASRYVATCGVVPERAVVRGCHRLGTAHSVPEGKIGIYNLA